MSKKTVNYKQCALMRNNYHHMAWIPEKFAIMDKYIKIKKDNDTWEDGWKVIGVSDGIKTSEEADDLSQLYKKTRKASDI